MRRLDEAGDRESQRRFQAGAAERGAVEFLHFLFRGPMRMAAGNDVERAVPEAGDAGFDAGCIRLVGSEITGVDGTVPTSLIGLKDQLWFPTASVTGRRRQHLPDLYLADPVCEPAADASPMGCCEKRAKYKYSGFQYSTVFPAAVPALTASKSVSPTSLNDNTGGPVTWTVTFQIKVWEALLRTPGKVVTYEEVAQSVGAPRGFRAVGGAVGRNPIAVLIPCHRVIRKMGEMGGYRYGLARKRALLGWEWSRQ